jgi:hypothetical protein
MPDLRSLPRQGVSRGNPDGLEGEQDSKAFIGSFFSSFDFGYDDRSVSIINPVDDSEVANTDSIQRFV